MRFMMTVHVPVEAGNAAIREGTFGAILQSMMDQLKPEAAYFGPIGGGRGGHVVINIDDVSQMAVISEALFMKLNASVDFKPVMTYEDLQRGLSALSQAADGA